MKKHTYNQQAIAHLMLAISQLNSTEEADLFFSDLCTPAELEAMADRWQVVAPLREGIPYRSIHEQTGVSITTITRVARCLTMGSGGYQMIAKRMELL